MKALFLVLIVPFLAYSYPATPDRAKTPGSLCNEKSPDFDGFRYPEKIAHCERNVDGRTKDRIYDAYGIPRAERREYTIDHLIPLSIGGTNEIRNLWPEHRKVKATRPELENEVHEYVSEGRISQQEAIERVLKVKFEAAPRLIEADEETALADE